MTDRTTLVQRLREYHREVTELDGGECPALAMVREAADEIERLQRELAEARRDAERYRWLRDKSPAKWTIDVGDLPLFKFDLDAAIDAAMEQGHE
jgi:predicted 3-demethylubiquinone-9 3-methyltransferase (glyoxalase superfamily)